MHVLAYEDSFNFLSAAGVRIIQLQDKSLLHSHWILINLLIWVAHWFIPILLLNVHSTCIPSCVANFLRAGSLILYDGFRCSEGCHSTYTLWKHCRIATFWAFLCHSTLQGDIEEHQFTTFIAITHTSVIIIDSSSVTHSRN